jgi:hypothetical protein
MTARSEIGVDDHELPPTSAYQRDQSRARRANGESEEHAGEPCSEPAAFAAHRLDEIDMKPRAAVVQGLGFDEGAVGAIVGAPNAGKTAFAISLMLHSASRSGTWLGLKIAGGPGLYFGAEAPGSVIMRGKAAAQRLSIRNPPLYISASVPGLGGEISAAIDADRIIATAHAIAELEGEAVKLISIDTLAACLADGDENSDGMLRLVDGAKRIALETCACVLLIHHPSKGDAASLRGHGSLAAACDSIVRIDVDELTGVRTAVLVKARDYATGLQLRFELEKVILDERDSFGDPRSTIVVRPTTQPVAHPRPSGRRQQELLTELERRYRAGERVWDEATARQAADGLGMQKSSAISAVKGLITSGFLTGSNASLTLKYPPNEGTK